MVLPLYCWLRSLLYSLHKRQNGTQSSFEQIWKQKKCRVRAGFGPRLFSLPTKNLRAMPAATIVADQNLAVEMSSRCGYQGQLRLSCTLRWIFESQMRAGGYLLPRNYLLGFLLLLLLCICCQNKQSCWRIKAKSAVQHIGLKTLGFERETRGGGGGGGRGGPSSLIQHKHTFYGPVLLMVRISMWVILEICARALCWLRMWLRLYRVMQ